MYDRNIFKTESHGRKESVQSTTQNPLAQHESHQLQHSAYSLFVQHSSIANHNIWIDSQHWF